MKPDIQFNCDLGIGGETGISPEMEKLCRQNSMSLEGKLTKLVSGLDLPVCDTYSMIEEKGAMDGAQ